MVFTLLRERTFTITVDEDGDIDERSIIMLLDMHFNMGNVPALKEEFHRKRRLYLR